MSIGRSQTVAVGTHLCSGNVASDFPGASEVYFGTLSLTQPHTNTVDGTIHKGVFRSHG